MACVCCETSPGTSVFRALTEAKLAVQFTELALSVVVFVREILFVFLLNGSRKSKHVLLGRQRLLGLSFAIHNPFMVCRSVEGCILTVWSRRSKDLTGESRNKGLFVAGAYIAGTYPTNPVTQPFQTGMFKSSGPERGAKLLFL